MIIFPRDIEGWGRDPQVAHLRTKNGEEPPPHREISP